MSEWDTSLAGCFADVADDLRGLHACFGTRTHRTFLVWCDQRTGDLVREVELTPPPRVTLEGSRYQHAERGIVRSGEAFVSEISLRYEASLLRGEMEGEGVPEALAFRYELRPIVDGVVIRGTLSSDPVRDHMAAEQRLSLAVQAHAERMGDVYA